MGGAVDEQSAVPSPEATEAGGEQAAGEDIEGAALDAVFG
jgi:hypothetical protein